MPILSSKIEIKYFHRSESHAFELQRSNYSYTRCPTVDPEWVDDLSEKLFDWIEDKVMRWDVMRNHARSRGRIIVLSPV